MQPSALPSGLPAALPPGAIVVGRFNDAFAALGRALNFLRTVEPFASYGFGTFASTVAAQIERGHYLVALRDGQVVAYCGYALCDPAVAEAWVQGRYVPSFDQYRGGDVMVLTTLHAASREAFRVLCREGRKILPKVRVVFRRDYPNGRPSRVGRVVNR